MQVAVRGADGTRFGSGYQVSGGLVLTAEHVVRRASAVAVRFVDGPGRVREVSGMVAWADRSTDLAVVRLARETPGLTPVCYGRLAGPAACEAVGYPRFKLREEQLTADDAHPGVYRDSHHVQGTCTPLSNRRSGTLELTVVPPDRDPNPGRSPWEGMSGAAVFAAGVLVALVSEHHRREGPNHLTARIVEQWQSLDPGRLAELRALLGVPDAGHLVPVGTTPAPVAGAGRGLPRDVATFTGRTAELDQLAASLDDAGGGVLAIHAVDGMAGVGKSAFAVHAAHLLASRFPDGQVFLPLNSHTPGLAPVTAKAGLAALLLGDGLATTALPDGLAAREQLWRTRTADRRMLLVLDDALDADQVRPLLPAAPKTLVLITSRRRLAGLDDVIPLSLAVLAPDEAAALFVRTARRPGLQATDPQVAHLVKLCGFLPLAVRMTAARLPHHPAWIPSDLITQFKEAGSRLGALREQERTVAAAFDLSYRDLTNTQQRLFRLLGAHPGVDYDAPAAAALLDTDTAAARRLLSDLEEHRLIDETTTAHGRYRMHDLLREHAAALADTNPEGIEAGLARLLAYYQHTSSPAPHAKTDPDRERTLAWLRTERENLLACIHYAVGHNHAKPAIRLSAAIAPLLRTDGPRTDALALHARAAEIAQRTGDPLGQAEALDHPQRDGRRGRVAPRRARVWSGRSAGGARCRRTGPAAERPVTLSRR
ncbi:trypsin-like peptidase domain-containing protein [Streptomyces mirabilis]|uniref:trypsin-like peptidase domain-containing protein n=1 Tax=Streptomyces mirabilis TaxID=68239 RepID=UPI00333202BB